LKWHYPIGLLYDIFFGVRYPAPVWKITVHFKRFPEDRLLHCRMKEAVQSVFMSSLKEADQLKHHGEVIGRMTKKEHEQMWSGLVNNRFEQFWSANRKLMDNSGENAFRHIPLRVYRFDGTDATTIVQPPLQILHKPFRDDGVFVTLGDALAAVSPEFAETDKWSFVTQGIEIPLTSDLSWVCVEFAYPDNFIHLVARRPAETHEKTAELDELNWDKATIDDESEQPVEHTNDSKGAEAVRSGEISEIDAASLTLES
jgi:autophagy-related protein 5